MSVHEEDVWTVLRKLRMDLTDAQAKVTRAMEYLAALGIEDNGPVKLKLPCPTCGEKFPSPAAIEEHAYIHHNGPMPESDKRAARLAGLEL